MMQVKFLGYGLVVLSELKDLVSRDQLIRNRFSRDQFSPKSTQITVDREIFAVKNFLPIA